MRRLQDVSAMNKHAHVQCTKVRDDSAPKDVKAYQFEKRHPFIHALLPQQVIHCKVEIEQGQASFSLQLSHDQLPVQTTQLCVSRNSAVDLLLEFVKQPALLAQRYWLVAVENGIFCNIFDEFKFYHNIQKSLHFLVVTLTCFVIFNSSLFK